MIFEDVRNERCPFRPRECWFLCSHRRWVGRIGNPCGVLTPYLLGLYNFDIASLMKYDCNIINFDTRYVSLLRNWLRKAWLYPIHNFCIDRILNHILIINRTITILTSQYVNVLYTINKNANIIITIRKNTEFHSNYFFLYWIAATISTQRSEIFPLKNCWFGRPSTRPNYTSRRLHFPIGPSAHYGTTTR